MSALASIETAMLATAQNRTDTDAGGASAYAGARSSAGTSAGSSSGTEPAPDRQALRFLTAGSVDDGKSTLIGRLLYDSRALLADQIGTLRDRATSTDHRAEGGPDFDLSLLTDGLEAEREQGITIDVAYRYFATPQRKFIIADAPGHEQYTRNMVTAAAGSDAAVVLVDITKLQAATPSITPSPSTPLSPGQLPPSPFRLDPLSLAPLSLDPLPITGLPQADGAAPALLPQTRRHALLAHLLRVPSIVFAVNKLDAVADPGPAFAAVQASLQAFARDAGITVAAIVPVSALRGDNVVEPLRTGWYAGPSLLQVLQGLPNANAADALAGDGRVGIAESTEPARSAEPADRAGPAEPTEPIEPIQPTDRASRADAAVSAELAGAPLRLPVQYVARGLGTDPAAQPGIGEQPRTFWGRVAEGGVAVGDTVQVFPGGERARVAALRDANGPVQRVTAGRSAGVVLDRHLDISRGDWIGTPGVLQPTRRFTATLAWLDTEPATPGRKYLLRHGHRWVQARLAGIQHRLDIHSLQPIEAHTLAVNEIAEVSFDLQQPLPLAAFAQHRDAGALIVVDPASHRTSGAVLVLATVPEAA